VAAGAGREADKRPTEGPVFGLGEGRVDAARVDAPADAEAEADAEADADTDTLAEVDPAGDMEADILPSKVFVFCVKLPVIRRRASST
jgi:hypothetical protein